MNYNAICPGCNERYNAAFAKAGEITVRRCSQCPPPKTLHGNVLKASHLTQDDRRKAPAQLTGDHCTQVPGEYQERRRSRR